MTDFQFDWQPDIGKGGGEQQEAPRGTATFGESEGPDDEPGQPREKDAESTSTWGRIDLGAFLDGEYEPPMPTIGQRNDGVRLFYPGRIGSIFAEPEAGKTWFAMLVSASEMARGNDAMFIDFEDSFEGVVSRLLELGVQPDVIRKQFIYIRPEESPKSGDKEVLLGAVTPNTTLVWIDGVTEAMSLFGLRPDVDVDVAAFWKALPRKLAKTGAAVILLDHVVKNQDSRGRWASGSQHKLSGLNGTAFTLENIEPFGVGLRGMSRVYVAKDRPGQVRKHAVPTKHDPPYWLGDMVIESGFGGVLAHLYPPPNAAGADAPKEAPFKRPTALMERVSLFLEDARAQAEASGNETFLGYGKNVIEKSVTGNGPAIRAAADLLVAEGFAELVKDGQTKLHRVVKPFRAKDAS